MSTKTEQLLEKIGEVFPQGDTLNVSGSVVLTLADWDWLSAAQCLRDHEAFRFEQLIDLTVVDYLGYGHSEWNTHSVSLTGFGRATDYEGSQEMPANRFEVVVQLLSVELNQRLRLKTRLAENDSPALPSLTDIWPNANWYEREAFDLFGVRFEGHPDLRRILTDDGLEGHPMRKDFPTEGHLEMVFDEEKEEVVYRPVSIEVTPNVPRVIRANGEGQ